MPSETRTCPRTPGLPATCGFPASVLPPPRGKLRGPTFSALRVVDSQFYGSRVLQATDLSWGGGKHTGPRRLSEKRPFRDLEAGDPARHAARSGPRGAASLRPGPGNLPPPPPRPPPPRAARPPPRRPPRREPGRRAAAASQWPGAASPRAGIPATRAPRPHPPPARARAFVHPPHFRRGAPDTGEKEAQLAALVAAPPTVGQGRLAVAARGLLSLPRRDYFAEASAWRRARHGGGGGAPEVEGRRPAQASARPTRFARPLPPRAPRPAMAEPSPARRPVPLIESGKTRRPRPPRAAPGLGRGPLPAAAPALDPTPRLPAELYFLIARYLSAGPCRRAAQVSAGPAGGGGGGPVPARPRRRLGSRVEGAGRTRVPPAPLTARLVGCRCWCRSWSSTRSVLRGARRARPAASPRAPSLPRRGRSPSSPPRPPPAAPCPVPRPAPRGGHSCASRAFAVAAEEVGLGGQRAQQELRGIGEVFDISIPCFRAPALRPLVGAPALGPKRPSCARGRPRESGDSSAGFVLFWGGRVCFGRKRPRRGWGGWRLPGGGDDPAPRFAVGWVPRCCCLW